LVAARPLLASGEVNDVLGGSGELGSWIIRDRDRDGS
jgi:hypothetical protein